MAEDKALEELREGLVKAIKDLEADLNERFERLKGIVIDFITLGNGFAVGTLKAALEKV